MGSGLIHSRSCNQLAEINWVFLGADLTKITPFIGSSCRPNRKLPVLYILSLSDGLFGPGLGKDLILATALLEGGGCWAVVAVLKRYSGGCRSRCLRL
jgi:hypothetical protein